MKHKTTQSVLVIEILLASASLAATSPALPEDWDVDLAAKPPHVFTLQRPRGETYELKAALKRHGKPFEPAITNAFIFWQTNGMENLYWSAPASVSNNVLRAFWLPEMDPGATSVRGYIGDPGHIYAAAFQFRFIASPGATPNELPLPQKVIDFAKVTVLNPPWSGGGGGGVDTNAVREIIHATVDGAARPLPKYLHALDFDDSYPDAAAEYYRSRGDGKVDGGCSAVRDGGFLYRNFDFPFDDRAEFVVRCVATAPSPSCPNGRYASVGVSQVGTNLTEQIVTSGKPSRWYKALPGATVDGINENGVVAEINVVGGDPEWRSGIPSASQIHPLAAVRWALDNGTSAEMVATNLAARIAFPEVWTQNFHYMVADSTSTWIVENGEAYRSGEAESLPLQALTNFRLYGDPKDTTGEGQERYIALTNGANITSQWWTLTYTESGYRASDLPGITGEELTRLFNYWAEKPREAHRGETFGGITWWQSIHTSIYDITNRTLRVAAQETDDWYVFAVPSAGGVSPVAVREIAREEITPATNQLSQTLSDSTNRLYETLSDSIVAVTNGIPEAIDGKLDKAGGTVTTSHGNDTWLTLNNSYGLAGSIGTANLYGGSWQRLFLGGVTRGEFEVEEWNDISVGRVTMDPYGWEEEHLGDVLDEKRDLTNNVCTASSGFSAWTCDPPLPDGYFIKEVYHDGVTDCFICKPDGSEVSGPALESDDGLYVEWSGGVAYYHDVTATRRRLATEGRTFVTDDFVTNAVAAATGYTPSADDPVFSNAVLAVNIGFVTNTTGAAYVAVTNALAGFGFDADALAELPGGEVYGSVGTLLVALAAAVAWLKRKALTNGKRTDGSPEDEKLRDFFSKSNSLLTGVVDGKIRYALATATSALADRTVNAVTLNDTNLTLTFPDPVSDKARDFLIRISKPTGATATLSITEPTLSTLYGDDWPSPEAGKNYLVAVTETAANEFYVRTLEITEVA